MTPLLPIYVRNTLPKAMDTNTNSTGTSNLGTNLESIRFVEICSKETAGMVRSNSNL